ncbi:hypothetical protein CCM_07830 [Cordyceps militaris CM01]|uniref:Uncharacterized protein n=1 Tax=Cordyceps militaris (strain CM01) TaxID=983644 RepID=G3JNW8_CORMM|nr:uncharacterized protein CCM_07830 [Cordyceps militaris CM01]EGX89578.1 hypothetical protein CCM_07830 [Cordyceps militaris CM01]
MTSESRVSFAVQMPPSGLNTGAAPCRRLVVRNAEDSNHEPWRRHRDHLPPPIDMAAPPSPTWEQLLGEAPHGSGHIHMDEAATGLA